VSPSSIYVATKHAVEGLTKPVALEFAKQGIPVNSVPPGGIEIDMLDRVAGKEGDRRNWLLSLHPVGRFGAGEEIAAAVPYLASDAAKFTTGTTLLVDGGLTAAESGNHQSRQRTLMSTHLTTQELDGNRIESTGSRLVRVS
jgi:NAD(P)-dependent dehydrogenase (short-subunit alcohol dehydrogenase family)